MIPTVYEFNLNTLGERIVTEHLVGFYKGIVDRITFLYIILIYINGVNEFTRHF